MISTILKALDKGDQSERERERENKNVKGTELPTGCFLNWSGPAPKISKCHLVDKFLYLKLFHKIFRIYLLADT